MKKIACLECANDISLEDRDYRIGEVLECSFCGTELEVIDVKDGNIVVDIIEEEK